uniref:Delta(14)-sterol reductase TM7SF2 n=1 Tax=Eptatretus burgeri TaxID=7764 RepID=A0A8C4QG07_EPTBU
CTIISIKSSLSSPSSTSQSHYWIKFIIIIIKGKFHDLNNSRKYTLFYVIQLFLNDHTCFAGNVFVDFYLGRELSPRIGRLNLKFLLMLRIAFLSWVRQQPPSGKTTKITNRCSPSLFHSSFFLESMTTGLGYITACGDFTIVPFAYPIQNYFLLHHPQGITVQATIYTILIYIFGFVMYVHSNDQKRSFCKDPNSFHKIQTKMGNYLLASGWWGWVRHPHYLGDIIVTMAWSLPCGLSYIVPHLYLFLCIFTLVNRAKVVEQDCHRKYGTAWEEYCRRVKYRFVPFIY